MKLQLSRVKNGAMSLLFLAAYVVAGVSPFVTTQAAYAKKPAEEPKKVFVCKYVGTPGEDERLQTGDNPISVSVNAIQHNQWDGTVPGWFSDKHDRSYVLEYDEGQPEPSVNECPDPDGPDKVPIPAVPGVNDPCGDDNATWIMPTNTEQVTWELKGGKLIASTTTGYVFTDGETKHDFGRAIDSGKECVKDQPPAPVVKADPCGTEKDMFTIPSAEGVKYYVNDVELAAGDHPTNGELLVTVKAVAAHDSGYTRDNSWTLPFTDVPCEEEGPVPVQYAIPTVEVVCGPNNDIVTVPLSGNHITYTSKGWKNGKFIVKAVTDEGYYFAGTDGKTVLKWKFVDKNTDCGGGNGEMRPVELLEPSVAVVCGPNNDTVTLPEVQHVTYSQTGWIDGKNTVKATVDEGYYIAGTEGETTMEWVLTDENTPCGGQVLGDTTPTPNVPVVAAAQLEDTGNSVVLPMLLSTGILGLALMTMLQRSGTRRSKLAAFVERAADRLYGAFAQPFVVPTV